MSDMSDKQTFISNTLDQMTTNEMIGQLMTLGSVDGVMWGPAASPDSQDMARMIEAGEVGFIMAPKRLDTTRSFQDAAMNRRAEGRPRIPLAFIEDVIHGNVTGFPINIAQAGSWDPQLVEDLARASIVEGTSIGLDVNFAPVADNANPHIGRIAETSGEPLVLRSAMSVAQVKGFQTDNLASPVAMAAVGKHLIGYQQNKIDYRGASVGPEEFNDEERPTFDAMLAAGLRGVMASFNTLNGIPMHANGEIIADFRKRNGDSKTIVYADFTGIEELEKHGLGTPEACTIRGLMEGVDVDLCSKRFMQYLPNAAQNGFVYEDAGMNYTAEQIRGRIREACGHVLEVKYDLGLFHDPYLRMKRNPEDVRMTPENLALSRRAAAETAILFTNKANHAGEKALPLKPGQKIALLGPFAAGNDARANYQGTWAVSTDPAKTLTLIDGLYEVLGKDAEINFQKCVDPLSDPNQVARANVHNRHYPTALIDQRSPEQMRAQAKEAIDKSEKVVFACGEPKEWTGESSTRMELGLPGDQQAVMEEMHAYAKAQGKQFIVVTFSGRPLVVPWIKQNADAHVHAWFGGTMAGLGLADVLTGKVNPSAKSPVTWPKHSVQEIRYNDLTGGRPMSPNSGRIAGDNEVDADGDTAFAKFQSGALDVPTVHKPLYYVGEGNDYNTYTYSEPRVNKTDLRGEGEYVEVSVSITNHGAYDGKPVAMLFMRDPVSSRSQPQKELLRFEKIDLAPGATRDVTFKVGVEDLEFSVAKTLLDKTKKWEPGEFIFMTGPSANPYDLETVSIDWRREFGAEPPRPPQELLKTTVSDSYVKAPFIASKLTDDELMDLVQQKAILRFTEGAHPETGMAIERTDPNAYGGIPLLATGGTGFGIQAIIVGVSRGWVDRNDALDQLHRITDYLEEAPKFNGAFPHFYNARTNGVYSMFRMDTGADIVETSFLMNGLLAARQFFSGANEQESMLRDKINTLWENVDWNHHTKNGAENMLFWHWSPEHEFGTNARIRGFNECMITYIMAASSPTHPISPDAYHQGWTENWDKRYKTLPDGKPDLLVPAPAFFEAFNFSGVDPRGLSDTYADDYFDLSRARLLQQREWAIKNPLGFKGYGENFWGFSESDGPTEYHACAPSLDRDRGTVAPYAVACAMPFAPEEAMAAMHHLYNEWGDKIWGPYGFNGALNPSKKWYSNDTVAIHQAQIPISIENHRSGLMWGLIMSCPEIQNGLTRLGFESPRLNPVLVADLTHISQAEFPDQPGLQF